MRLTQLWLLIACVLCVALPPASSRAESDAEMVVKSVMIRKFAEFVRWPEAIAPQKKMQVKVCVWGAPPPPEMAAVLAKSAASNPVKFSAATVSQASETNECHILFIGSDKQSQVSSILSSISAKPIMTVSDASSFVDKGGMIGFLIIDGKVRYDINNRAFGTAQLKVDAQLLEIANKVVE